MDICLLRHDHTKSLRVCYNKKRSQCKLILVVLVQIAIYMIQCTDSASRNIRHNQIFRLSVQTLDSFDQCIRNIADTVATDRCDFYILTIRILCIDNIICSQVICNDCCMFACAVNVLCKCYHRRCLSCSKETTDYHKTFFVHCFLPLFTFCRSFFLYFLYSLSHITIIAFFQIKNHSYFLITNDRYRFFLLLIIDYQLYFVSLVSSLTLVSSYKM